jgi:hypothetical protein
MNEPNTGMDDDRIDDLANSAKAWKRSTVETFVALMDGALQRNPNDVDAAAIRGVLIRELSSRHP